MNSRIEHHELALVIAHEIGDWWGEGSALFNPSLARDGVGKRVWAVERTEAMLQIFEQIESPYAERVWRRLAK